MLAGLFERLACAGKRAPQTSPVDALEPEGWAHNDNGEIVERLLQSKGGYAFFEHFRELQAQDVLRTKVFKGGGARHHDRW